MVSDCWRAYNKIEGNGYIHSIEFVGYEDPRVHTNSIEGSWRQAKLRLPPQGLASAVCTKKVVVTGIPSVF